MSKYTFLLPAFKTKYLAEMLESIKNQTYKDFKVLISDDCSPEPIREVCEPYLSDPRFSYRINEENMGSKSLVSHWNLLVDMCDTEFLIMASDDDVYAPTFLEEIDKLQVKYPEVDLLRARAQIIDDKGLFIRKDACYEEYVDQLEYICQYEYIWRIECVANMVCRTSALRHIGGYVDFPLAWSSDTATANTLAKNGCANTKDILFSFRMSGTNISSGELGNKAQILKKYMAVEMFDEYMLKLFRDIPKTNAIMYDFAVKAHVKHVMSALMYYSRILSWKQFLFFIRKYSSKGYFESKFDIYKCIRGKLRR